MNTQPLRFKHMRDMSEGPVMGGSFKFSSGYQWLQNHHVSRKG